MSNRKYDGVMIVGECLFFRGTGDSDPSMTMTTRGKIIQIVTWPRADDRWGISIDLGRRFAEIAVSAAQAQQVMQWFTGTKAPPPEILEIPDPVAQAAAYENWLKESS